ncbi:MAG: amidohydrolase family protein [Sphingobacteriaceae bacterium]
MRYITADRIFDGTQFLEDGSALGLDDTGKIVEITTINKLQTPHEKHEGILMPGFINAHCHLELSHMHGLIPQHTGLIDFAKNIIIKRNSAAPEQMQQSMKEADDFMKKAGIVAVGDISNNNVSFGIKRSSSIYYHTFIELIGLDPNRKSDILKTGVTLLDELQKDTLSGSLAPHAPYSTSVDLIAEISKFNTGRQLPLSIHNQENSEEDAFMQGKPSKFKDLYDFLKMDISWFKPSFKNSIQAYIHHLKGNKNILVHNTFTSENDIATSSDAIFWCCCPSANLHIEGVLPHYEILVKHNKSVCFGTDSLASNTDLSIIKEANLFYQKTNDLIATLKGLTSTGAKALGIDERFGSFKIGAKPGVNLITLNSNNLTLDRILF